MSYCWLKLERAGSLYSAGISARHSPILGENPPLVYSRVLGTAIYHSTIYTATIYSIQYAQGKRTHQTSQP